MRMRLPGAEIRRLPAWRWPDGLSGTLTFLAPLVALVVIWQAVVALFDVHPGIFPGVPAVFRAGIEAIRDGSLPMHVAASFARVRRAMPASASALVQAVTATTSNRSGLRSMRSSADFPTEPVAPRIAILRVTSAPIAGRRR